jgi:hypothetical protein
MVGSAITYTEQIREDGGSDHQTDTVYIEDPFTYRQTISDDLNGRGAFKPVAAVRQVAACVGEALDD